MLSTRIDQKITFEGDDMVVKNTFDATAALQDAAYGARAQPEHAWQ